MRQNTIKPVLCVFRQWKNKSYAVFSSLKKIIKISCLCISYSLLTKNTAVHAQIDSLTPVYDTEIEEITVFGDPILQATNISSTLIRVITKNDIHSSAAQSIDDLLRHTAGIDIRQRGPHGSQADISIRGGSFDQVIILLNGQNISDPQTGHFAFNIPVDIHDIERIELWYGNQAGIHSTSALCGVINIITQRKTTTGMEMNAGYGDYNFRKAHGAGYFSAKKNTMYISAGHTANNGYMHNTDFAGTQTYFLYHHKGKISIEAQGGYQEKALGANRFYSNRYPDQYDENSNIFGSIKASTGKALKILPSILYRRHNDHYVLIRNTPGVYQNYHYNQVYDICLPMSYKSRFGTSFIEAGIRNENIISNRLGEDITPIAIPGSDSLYHKGHNRNIQNIFVGHRFHNHRLSIYPALSFSMNSDYKNIALMYPSLETGLTITHRLSVFASIRKNYRLPTFTDLYYKSKNIRGNPDLQPETAITMETGGSYTGKIISISSTIYRRNAMNIIDWIWHDDTKLWHTENITRLISTGIDISMRILPRQINKYLSPVNDLSITYSYNELNKNSYSHISNYVLDNIKHRITGIIDYHLYKNISMSWNISYRERNGGYLVYDKASNRDEEIPYKPLWLIDTKIYYKKPTYLLYIETTNVFNKEYYDIGNIMQPGRWAKGGIKLLLDRKKQQPAQ